MSSCFNYAEIEPENCLDVLVSGKTTDGVYIINPGNGAFPVYCDQTTDGGGWTVLQRRMDGTVDFDRTYEEYEYVILVFLQLCHIHHHHHHYHHHHYQQHNITSPSSSTIVHH